RSLIGLGILGQYNNKIYHIDEIDWSVKPNDKFLKHDDTEINYGDYYKQNYDIFLTDLNQPMLVSYLKRRQDSLELRTVHLVPEFCFLTRIRPEKYVTRQRAIVGSGNDLKSLLVVGIDACKDSLNKRSSVIGLVASTNSRITRWFSRCILQNTGTDFADGLKICMKGALNKWMMFNHELPSCKIVYRDGVGDGQLKRVVDSEVPQLLNTMREFSSSRSPKVSVVVVRKKSIAKFFTEPQKALENPPVGFMVDSEVTCPEWQMQYDFYLIGHSVHQGIVSPTYFNDNRLKPDHMQRLTYKMCQLMITFQGVIRMPVPGQYAHKLTFLESQSIHKEPRLELSDSLFYLRWK
ncbi:LOW QUALITY PROTEIN: piwi-like protein 4, partial [Ornithorhynchus anatinus]|uniref:LOW QUALITY PROTEIN: piwi-like protein 4 n=1 Tax=Ornithorhynchus anatinus TaxID=9258 RepID=UPI0010A7D4C3